MIDLNSTTILVACLQSSTSQLGTHQNFLTLGVHFVNATRYMGAVNNTIEPENKRYLSNNNKRKTTVAFQQLIGLSCASIL